MLESIPTISYYIDITDDNIKAAVLKRLQSLGLKFKLPTGKESREKTKFYIIIDIYGSRYYNIEISYSWLYIDEEELKYVDLFTKKFLQWHNKKTPWIMRVLKNLKNMFLQE